MWWWWWRVPPHRADEAQRRVRHLLRCFGCPLRRPHVLQVAARKQQELRPQQQQHANCDADGGEGEDEGVQRGSLMSGEDRDRALQQTTQAAHTDEARQRRPAENARERVELDLICGVDGPSVFGW